MPVRKILIVGSGGREHAIAWAVSRSPQIEQIFVAPGNAGTAVIAENVALQPENSEGLVAFARERAVDLVVIGPEGPLAAGLADAFHSAGIAVFGPSKKAAQIEASKLFAKRLMAEQNIPTAHYAEFDDFEAATRYVEDLNRPLVVKADGLAAGKGVMVCETLSQARDALKTILVEGTFGKAGDRVIIEEFLEGPEISVLAFSDGRTVVPMVPARDHKRVFDEDRGPNTGGMGAFAPPDLEPGTMNIIRSSVLEPAVRAMAARGMPFVGVLYAGLILTKQGPMVLEFNCRFGDPETQAILPLLETDIVEIFHACVERRLDQLAVKWKAGACASVVLASGGYPGSYKTDLPITGVAEAEAAGEITVFHAGTRLDEAGQLVTAGGRVLAVSAVASDLDAAVALAYEGASKIHFEGVHYRKDIGTQR